MKHFSFKILLLCILLPPVLYIVTFQLVEGSIQRACSREIEEIYIGDTRPLFQGSLHIEDAIQQNIRRYMESKRLFSWGAKVNITVRTQGGAILYPAVYRESADSEMIPPSSIQIAEENYALLSEGLVVSVDLKLGHTHFVSLSILIAYILMALMVLYLQYQASLRKTIQEEIQKEKELARFGEQEKMYAHTMERLKKEKKDLSHELNQLKQRLSTEREKALRNEDEMIEEIVALEEKLKENLKLQESQLSKIDTLVQKTEQFERGELKSKKQRLKAAASAQKRFNTLYKNISFHAKAVSGFTSLTSELQLKAEEVVSLLNDDPSLVTIKRKVFGKKNRVTVFEVIFGYKGRLYYRNTIENRLEIVSIGTKHTQTKDLEFLDTL